MNEFKRLSGPVPVGSTGNTARRSYEITKNSAVNDVVLKLLNDISIAEDLISHYNDETFENALYTTAFECLQRVIDGKLPPIGSYQACIVAALSLIALKQYDGDLHSHIESKFREYRPSWEHFYSRSVIRNAVYKVVRSYRNRVQYFDSHSYVAVPLVIACVPHYRVGDLFRISYDIYKQKLLFDEDVSDEQIKDKVSEVLHALRRKDLISDSDVIKGTNYLMSKYTQSCIYSGYGIDALATIISNCIRLIIFHLTRSEDSYTVDAYYTEGFDAWIKAFEGDAKEKEKFEKNRMVSRPFFKLYHDEIHLFTGEYNMDDSCDPNDVHICIYSNGQLIFDKLLDDPNDIELADEEDTLGGYIINRKEFVLPSTPLGELSYRIVCSDQEVYDSKNRLYRTNLFFDGKGNEVKPGTEYEGEIFVVSSKSNAEEYDDRIVKRHHKKDYFISSIEVNSHDVFHFDGEPYIFFKVMGSKIISHEVSWAEFETVESKRYPIYNDIKILFQASCNRYDIYFSIDGQTVSCGEEMEFDYKIQILSTDYNGNGTYVLKICHLDPGFHTIKVYNARTDKQIKGANFGIIYDPDMRKSFLSKDSIGISYEIRGSFAEDQIMVYEYGASRKKLRGFVKNLGHGSLIIYPSSISYSIDGSFWFDADHKLYLCDVPTFTKSIFICGPKGMTAHLYTQNAVVKKQILNLSREDCDNRYKLFIEYLRTLSDMTCAKIMLEYGNCTKFFNIWYYPYIAREDIAMHFNEEQRRHIFRIPFEGNSQIKAIFRPVNSDEVIASKIIKSGDEIAIEDSDIPKEVRFLSISLCGRKYGSIFDQYQKKPFMTLPKYDLGRTKLRLTTWPPQFPYDSKLNTFSFRIGFEGATHIRIEVRPSGYKRTLFSQVVSSEELCHCDLSQYLFNSYNVLLYGSTDDKGTEFSEKPFYVSKAIKVNSPLIKQKYQISHFIMADGKKTTANYSLYFVKYTEVENKCFWLCKLIDNRTGSSYDDMLVSLKKTSAFSYEISLSRLYKEKITDLKFKDGRQVSGAILDKLGGWK